MEGNAISRKAPVDIRCAIVVVGLRDRVHSLSLGGRALAVRHKDPMRTFGRGNHVDFVLPFWNGDGRFHEHPSQDSGACLVETRRR